MMKNLIPVLLLLAFFALGCGSSNSNSGVLTSLGFDDETDQATVLVGKANDDLREIRKIQKANAGKVEELGEAIKGRDTAAVQKILDELISAIQDGLSYGETARQKIEEAGEKKTNDKFNEYLRLKEQALQKQIDAFTFRLKVAKTLREKFGTDKTEEIESAKAEFQNQEENFKKLWEAADDLSERANKIARENPNKIKTKS